MQISFTVEGRLPGLNEILAAAKSHYAVYSKLKKQWTEVCQWAIKIHKIKPIESPIEIKLHWIEKTHRRDLDNICTGIKFILDGLVASEILPNDTQKWVTGISHTFGEPDKNRPRVIVTLISMENAEIKK